ncbi:MAG TPA: HEAT repeat domain-containing protein [Candidatus Krumholzibacteria bacterium]|nr:HEAT repeat domain-containing protein [Candidatus Krumholzibacteria bacterium]
MRRLCILALFLICTGAQAATLADAIATADDGWLHLQYATREGVRGNGHDLTIDGSDNWTRNLDDGPAYVQLRVRDGRVVDVDVTVGGRAPRVRDGELDLGTVDPIEAAIALLGVAEEATTDDVEDAILGAVIAEGFDQHGRLFAIARDGDRPHDLRRSAVFWLGQAAGERATEHLTAIVDDDDTELSVREHAIFALSQRPIDECLEPLRRVATTSRHPQLREKAFFWLAQHDDPRVLDLFEDVLLSKN